MDWFDRLGLWMAGLVVVAIAASICGWIANVVKLFGMLNDPVSAMLFARIAGVIVPPFGAIIGFL